MTAPALSPCPFCGGPGELLELRTSAGDPSGWRVWCPTLPCCAAGPAVETEADARDKWNAATARPLPPALTVAEAAALADALESAARHRGHMDHEMFADSGRTASAAAVASARAAIIAALTGREGGEA